MGLLIIVTSHPDNIPVGVSKVEKPQSNDTVYRWASFPLTFFKVAHCPSQFSLSSFTYGHSPVVCTTNGHSWPVRSNDTTSRNCCFDHTPRFALFRNQGFAVSLPFKPITSGSCSSSIYIPLLPVFSIGGKRH